MLYLHETIDIIGSGQDAYLQAVAERAVHSEAAGISRLVGCWRVVGSTGRWPQVVNLWEMDGWGPWAESLERQFVPERRDPELAPWWSRTAEFRSGGFDRILAPVSGSPTRAELHASGQRGWVFEQTIARAAPGKGAALLDSALGNLLPAVRRRGFFLVGAYVVPMRSDEIVFLWGAPTFAALCGWYDERDALPSWGRWQKDVASIGRETASCWLVPAETCALHPEHRRSGERERRPKRTRAGR